MRVGIDLVSIPEVSESIARFGHKYLDRVFTPRELDDCGGDADQLASRLAARFAAKEAATKVLRPGDQGIGWRSIEVQRDPQGWTELALQGEAAALARSQGLNSFALSISHEGNYATAVVVACHATGSQEGDDTQPFYA
ncbi:MAG: holo-ACP synthase [Chloroflexota bacterium]